MLYIHLSDWSFLRSSVAVKCRCTLRIGVILLGLSPVHSASNTSQLNVHCLQQTTIIFSIIREIEFVYGTNASRLFVDAPEELHQQQGDPEESTAATYHPRYGSQRDVHGPQSQPLAVLSLPHYLVHARIGFDWEHEPGVSHQPRPLQELIRRKQHEHRYTSKLRREEPSFPPIS